MEREEALQTLALLQRVVAQARDDTSLQNWGIIWMIHAATNGLGFILTGNLIAYGTPGPWVYVGLWCVVLVFNFTTIFLLKRGTGGTRSFIEAQIWNIWLGFIGAVALTGVVNHLGGWPLFALGPIIAVLSAFAFGMMGAVIGRVWYWVSALFVVVALGMAAYPQEQFLTLGCAWGGCQFVAGWFMHQAKKRREAAARLV